MKIYKAENFRYGRSFFSRIMLILDLALAVGVFVILKILNGSTNPDLFAALGFDAESIEVLKGNMYGIRYVFASLSGIDILMMLTGIVIALHISSDYSEHTIRYEQCGTDRRVVYLKRLLSACTFSICITLIYILASAIIAAIAMRASIQGGELVTAGMLLLEEMVLVCGFTAFVFMIFTMIKNQIISVVAVIILMMLITPGIRLMCEAIGISGICENVFITSMLSGVTTFSALCSRSFLHILVGIIYFIISYIIGARVYGKQKI